MATGMFCVIEASLLVLFFCPLLTSSPRNVSSSAGSKTDAERDGPVGSRVNNAVIRHHLDAEERSFKTNDSAFHFYEVIILLMV